MKKTKIKALRDVLIMLLILISFIVSAFIWPIVFACICLVAAVLTILSLIIKFAHVTYEERVLYYERKKIEDQPIDRNL